MNTKSFVYRNLITAGCFIVLFLLFCLPDVVLYAPHQPGQLTIGLFFTSSFFLLPLILFRKHIKLYVTLISIFGFFSLLATIPILYFGLKLDKEVMELIYNTNYDEASELMRPYILPILIAVLVYIVIIVLIVKMCPKTLSKKVTWKIVLISFAIIFITPIFDMGNNSYVKSFKSSARYYPFYVAYYGRQFYKEVSLFRNHPEWTKDFHFNARQKRNIKQRQIYVFFIGESSRYDHWSINGYNRNTSPLLSQESDLMSFGKVCAAGGETELSVPMLLAPVRPGNFNEIFHTKGIFTLFREAGFHTYWVSDQVDGGKVMMFAKEANEMKLLRDMDRFNNQSIFDMDLIYFLKDIIEKDTGNLFIIIHSMGSHFAYNQRYPDNYNYFRPSGGKKLFQSGLSSLKQEYINGYDNAILYDDVVIDTAIHILRQANAISFLYYISDHGENLDDNGNGLFMHDPIRPTKYIAHVPLFIYTSPAYDNVFPEKLAALESHVENRIDGYQTFNTIADMANLTYSNQDTTQSFASFGFKDTTRFILGGDGSVYRFNELLPDIR